ncbi:MAG: DUF3786 domain-containing protein [Bacillota bacterium]
MSFGDGVRIAACIFKNRPLELMADCTGARVESPGLLSLVYMGQPVLVTYPEGGVRGVDGQSLSEEEQIVILRYLASLGGLPPKGKWLSFLELPGGPHHYAPFVKEAIEPLETEFCSWSEFQEACVASGGTEIDGVRGYSMAVLPHLRLGSVLWGPDETGAFSANILFDAVAPHYLPTDCLYVLGILFSRHLLRAKKTRTLT